MADSTTKIMRCIHTGLLCVQRNVADRLSVCLDPLNPRLRFTSCVFVLFFFFMRFGVTRLLFMYCSLNSNRKCWLFRSKQCTSVLFMDPQIPLFSNFFIKNGSHSTIHTFKNYFATVFSVFSFSKISSIQTDPNYTSVIRTFNSFSIALPFPWEPAFFIHSNIKSNLSS